MRQLCLVLGFTLIVLVIITGCSTSSKGSSVQMITQPASTSSVISSIQMTTQPTSTSSDLKIGDTAIIEYNGLKKAFKVTKYEGGIVYYEIKNIGDKAIPKIPFWFVDWGGVRHDSIDPWFSGSDLYPGETMSSQQSLMKFRGLSGKAMEGKLYYCTGLGDQEACIMIKS